MMGLFSNIVMLKPRLLIFAWGLYDLANQFFALNIVSLYFIRWITIEKQTPELFFGISFGLSMLLVAILAPFLGAVSDLMHRHRFFLIVFTLLSIIFTISLGLTENVIWGLTFFAIANFGCQAAVIFYNALLINIAPIDKIGFVSGIGKMLGYCGAVIGLYIIRPLVLESGYHAAFVPTGLLFFIFALPCMLFIKDRGFQARSNTPSFLETVKYSLSFKQFLKRNVDFIRAQRLHNFLKAAFFCLIVVNTIMIFMSVYVTRVFGLTEPQIINLVLFSTFFAIGGSFFSGYISDYLGYKKSLYFVFLIWGICLLSGAVAKNIIFYWIIGPLVGVALGSTWVILRALVIQITPADKIGEGFGLFNLIGYVSAIAGALIWGGLLWFLSPLYGELGYRIALAALIIFLLPGFVYLRRI